MKQELKFRDRGVSADRALEIMTWAARQVDQAEFYLQIGSPSLFGGHYDVAVDFKENEELATAFKLIFCEEE